MLLLTNGSVRLLFIAQALYWSCSLIGITLTSLVGLDLAPLPELATLPLALLLVGNLACVHPLAMIMSRRAPQTGLFLGAISGVIGELICGGGGFIRPNSLWYVLGTIADGRGIPAPAMFLSLLPALESGMKTGKKRPGRAGSLLVGPPGFPGPPL